MNSIYCKERGFTLGELMITITIIAVLSATGIPQLMKWRENARLSSASRKVLSCFQLARMSAIKFNSFCTITFNQEVNGIDYDLVVYVDSDSDLEYDPGEKIIGRVLLSDFGTVEFDTSKGKGRGISFNENDDKLPAVAFASNGLSKNNSKGMGMGSVFFINKTNKKAKVVVASTGNIRIE